jgi:membrane protease YdiL (CAAX protease family)
VSASAEDPRDEEERPGGGVACPDCGARIPSSARFCPACGLEGPGYAEWFRQVAPPVVPEFMERLRLEGRPATRVLLAMIAALAASVPVALSGGGDGLVLGTLFMAFAIGACVFVERRDVVPLVRRIGAPSWWLVAVVGGLTLPFVGSAWAELVMGIGEMPHQNPFAELSRTEAVVIVCLAPGIFEELAFRGIVLDTALRLMRPGMAQLATAALFAGVHLSPLVFPYHVLVGILLGLLRTRSGSLVPCMAAHALHNYAVLFLVP